MADTYLSTIGTTSTTTGGYIYIIRPDGGSPTGYTSYRISVINLQASLQTQITTNASDISTLSSQIDILNNLLTKNKYEDIVSDFEYNQTANSTIYKITAKSSSNASFKIGTTLDGDEIQEEITLTSEYNYVFELDIDIPTGYNESARTIYISITSGTITFGIYNRLNEF